MTEKEQPEKPKKRLVGRPRKPAPRINAPVKTVLAFVLRTRRSAPKR